jgi:hypothetical protein
MKKSTKNKDIDQDMIDEEMARIIPGKYRKDSLEQNKISLETNSYAGYIYKFIKKITGGLRMLSRFFLHFCLEN